MIPKSNRLIGMIVGIALLASGCSGAIGLLDGAPSTNQSDSPDASGPSERAISTLSTKVLFDSSPDAVQTPSVSVLGFKRTGTQAVGDRIALNDTPRSLTKARVTFGSWARPSQAASPQTGAQTYPIRLTLYAAVEADSQTPGAKIASQTEWVTIPWHESSHDGPSDCQRPATTPSTQSASLDLCSDATIFTAAFDFSDQGVTSSRELIYRVELASAPEAADDENDRLADPSTFGPAMVTSTAMAPQPSLGTDLDPRTIFWAPDADRELPTSDLITGSFQRIAPDSPFTSAIRIIGTEQ